MRGFSIATMGTTLAAIAIVAPAQAQVAPSRAPAVVWYRSSEGCPDGDAFLAKLGEKASLARLARGGDRVDFVVTLGASTDGSQGRLERQTQNGTVAIRELHDDSCSNIADALALSLALALDPESQTTAADVDSAPAAAEPDATRVEAPGPTPAPRVRRQSVPPGPPSLPSTSRWPWSVGLDGGVVTSVLPTPLLRLDAFAELRRQGRGWSLRAGPAVLTGSTHADTGEVRLWIAVAHVDGCPLALGSDVVQIAPCAAFDVGAIHVSAVGADTGFWAAFQGLVRVRLQIGGPFTLEAHGGGDFPLTRYEIRAGPGGPPRAGVVGIDVGAGVAVELP